MKIGILTQPLHNNYGGLLQNYALQQVLIKAGYEVETLDHEVNNTRNLKEFLYRIKTLLLHVIRPDKYKKPAYNPTPTEVAEIRKLTNRFIQENIKRTYKITSKDGFNALIKANHYDALIVGSDQCWRPRYNSLPSAMFLDFAAHCKDVKRIAYAASFGTDNWEYSSGLESRCAKLVKMFDLVTVRESSAVGLCKEHFGIEAKHVLDPTMLLNKEDYIKLVEQRHEPRSNGSLFNYILDPSNINTDFVNKAACELSMKPFSVLPEIQAEVRTKSDVKNRIAACVYPAITAWLRAFMDAEMVICDSFHGCVFSIIFNKPFWVLGNKRRGNARFDSLLKLFNLEDRLVSATESIDLQKTIDWNHVNAILEEKRSYSKSLLLNALNHSLCPK